MKPLARLKRIRLLQEQVAEKELLAARAEAEASARRLAGMERQETLARGRATDAVLAGDPEEAYWSSREHAASRAALPRASLDAGAKTASRDLAEAAYLNAHREHSLLEHLVQGEARRQRTVAGRREQRELDDAFAARPFWNGRGQPEPEDG